VCEIAANYRQKFHKDVVVDLIGYRRHGHNELDQPMFTHPLTYKKIATHPPAVEIYEKQLLEAGVIDK